MKPEATKEAAETGAVDKNLMPSEVARQQRLQMGNSQRPSSANSTYHHEDQARPISTSHLLRSAQQVAVAGPQHPRHEFDQDGLILPRRVQHHPNVVAQPIIRDLNRELKFNQVRGKNVLDQKSELKKAMEKLEDGKRKKEIEKDRLNRRTSLELRLEERAERIARDSEIQPSDSSSCNPMRNFTITNR